MDIFAQRLKELRTEKQLTMDMVVYDMGIKFNIELTRSHLSRWESGKTEPSIRYAAYLAKYYGVSLDYLMGLTNSRVPVNLLVKEQKQKKGGGDNEPQSK